MSINRGADNNPRVTSLSIIDPYTSSSEGHTSEEDCVANSEDRSATRALLQAGRSLEGLWEREADNNPAGYRSSRERHSNGVNRNGQTCSSNSSETSEERGEAAPLTFTKKEVAQAGSSMLHSWWSSLITPTLRKRLYVAFVVMFFAGSSLGAIFVNKRCLTGYNFNYPLTIMLAQMIFAVVVISLLQFTNYVSIPDFRNENLIMLAIPTVLFTSNIVVGLSALYLVNIPMFSAFRRLTLLFVMAAEFVLLKKRYSRGIINSVVVMAFGAFISAVDDVTFSTLGYSLVLMNNLLTALYLASIKRIMRETEFDPLSLLFHTAFIGMPFVGALCVVTGEAKNVIQAFKTQPDLRTVPFLTSLSLAATGAFAVNFSTSLCTHVTSPLTTSVAGQVKNVLQTFLGFFSWGFVPTRMNVFGLLVALGAQLAFAFLKYKESNDEKAAKTAEVEQSPGGAANQLSQNSSSKEETLMNLPTAS